MESSPQPLVSVVTPFYNTASYLAECIESVLAQDYRNFEYILVDNRSSDGSGEIAARYASRDSRVRLVQTSELLPQVPNYNFALSQIDPASVYCKVVQADDWVYPRCLTEMVALANAHPNVTLVSSYELKEDKLSGEGLHPSCTVIDGRDACRMYLLQGIHLFGSPTTVLYRSDVVRARHPFYEEGRLHEDTETAFEVLTEGEFGFVHQVLSFSRQQGGSLYGSMQGFLPRHLDGLILAKRYGQRFLTETEFRSCMERRMAAYYRALGRRLLWQRGRPERAFWEHQRRALATIGEEVRPELIAKHLVPALWEVGKPAGVARLLATLAERELA